MLNLSQRLILGCVLLATLTVGMVAATHRALQAAGLAGLAWAFVVASILVALGTALFVLQPIHRLAKDAHKIAQGNLDYRTSWSSRDDFGVIAAELNRLAVRLRDLHDSEAGRRQMEFQLDIRSGPQAGKKIPVLTGSVVSIGRTRGSLLFPEDSGEACALYVQLGCRCAYVRDAAVVRPDLSAPC